MLDCGARPNATNHLGSSPLYIASLATNFDQAIIEVLLNKGAHVDMKNKNGDRPSRQMEENPRCTISIARYTSLKCLCAQVITRHSIKYQGEVPNVLETFIHAH
jgi:hypothetical protein